VARGKPALSREEKREEEEEEGAVQLCSSDTFVLASAAFLLVHAFNSVSLAMTTARRVRPDKSWLLLLTPTTALLAFGLRSIVRSLTTPYELQTDRQPLHSLAFCCPKQIDAAATRCYETGRGMK
jgi:hypothetical protein